MPSPKRPLLVNDDPSHDLDLVGITGTNGKTTTTYLCFAIAQAAGRKPAMLTTVEYRIGETSETAVRTTPEASDTNRFLRQRSTRAAGRRDGGFVSGDRPAPLRRLRFKVAIFTNLTRDHLDYHLTMENYFDAKKRLFDGRLGEQPSSSIINIDDEWGGSLADELRDCGQQVVTLSLDAAKPT